MTIKSIIEDVVDNIGGPAFDREYFATTFPANRALQHRTGDYRRPQRRTSSFDLSADLRKQDAPVKGNVATRDRSTGAITYIGPFGLWMFARDIAIEHGVNRNAEDGTFSVIPQRWEMALI